MTTAAPVTTIEKTTRDAARPYMVVLPKRFLRRVVGWYASEEQAKDCKRRWDRRLKADWEARQS